jgi:hypothetical protein
MLIIGQCYVGIEDFQVFLDSMKNEEEKARVESWIETFKKGENPFTSEVLEELKNESSRVLRQH